VRRLAALAALGAVVACAKLGAPPGGPLRTTPPVLLRVIPDSGAVNVAIRGVVFEFDVVTNDRAGGAAGDLENLFLMSPQEGRPRVIWRRERIEIRPRRGFRPNTAYSVTMLPGIADLRGNTLLTGRTVIFSTGPTIPPYFVHGRVFDWMNERVAPRALVEVIRRPDSLTFVGAADSSGQFSVGPLDEGNYVVRAIVDANNNRVVDPGESWDSLPIVVRGTSPFLELLAAPRDTIAPRLLTVSARDSLTLAASFDRPIDPSFPLTPASIRVVGGADSVALRVAGVRTRAQEDAAERARSDSAARADTSARADSARARRDTGGVRGAPPVIQARPSRPAPAKELVVRLDPQTPLRPGSVYRVTAVNIRGLLGQTRPTDRIITVPARAAPRDTTPPAEVPRR
jgi:hypothetical protein